MRWLRAVAVLGLTTACAVTTPTDSAPRPRALERPAQPALWVDFEDVEVDLGAAVHHAENAGAAPAQVEVATRGGGRATLTGGPLSGHGVRLPAYAAEPDTPGAVLVVRPTSAGADPFTPDDQDFRFGADVSLDLVSSGDGPDDGDNLIQRGRFADAAQFKIQLDHGVPSCRVAGSAGTSLVRSDTPVLRGRWYRIACTRTGAEITLEVRDIEGDGPVAFFTTSGDVGVVSPAKGDLLSIGGKVSRDGTIPTTQPDQLNGSIDNVVFETTARS
jgi:Laminin G domain